MAALIPPSAIPLSPAEEDNDVEVTREDQSRINEFGRLNARKFEARDEALEAKKRNEGLSDAEEGVMLADESRAGCIKVQVGDCFVDVDTAYATEYIEQQRAKNNSSIDTIEEELRGIEIRQADLKKLLYAKFGKGINLEDC